MLPTRGFQSAGEPFGLGPAQRLPAFQNLPPGRLVQDSGGREFFQQQHLGACQGPIDLLATGLDPPAQTGAIELATAAHEGKDTQEDEERAHRVISSENVPSAIVSGMPFVKSPAPCGLVLAVLVSGCPAHERARIAKKRMRAPRTRAIRLPPLVVSASEGMVADAQDLDRRARKAFRAGKYLEAARLFRLLSQVAQGEATRWSAAFNEAASLEAAGRHGQAAARYALAGRIASSPAQRLRALFARGRCLLRVGKPREAAAVLARVLRSVHLSPDSVFETAPLLAQALVATGDGQKALGALRECLETFRLLGRPAQHRTAAARCTFWQGRVHEAAMRRLPVPTHPDKVGPWLLETARQLDLARRAYLKVLRHDGGTWAYRALRRVVALLEHFRRAVLSAPVPRFRPFLYYDARSRQWKRMAAERILRRYEQKVRRLLRSSLETALHMLRRHLKTTAGLQPWVRLALERDMARLARTVANLDALHLELPSSKGSPPRGQPAWEPPLPLPCPFRPMVLGLQAPALPPRPPAREIKGQGSRPGR